MSNPYIPNKQEIEMDGLLKDLQNENKRLHNVIAVYEAQRNKLFESARAQESTIQYLNNLFKSENKVANSFSKYVLKNLKPTILQPSVQSAVGDKIQLCPDQLSNLTGTPNRINYDKYFPIHDDVDIFKPENLRVKVYEIKFVYTNPAFLSVKAFYCVELYLNDQFDWISRFKKPNFEYRQYWSDDDYEQRQLNENCQIIFGINTSTNEIAFIQNNSCQDRESEWGRRLATESEFEETMMLRFGAFKKTHRKIENANKSKMKIFEDHYTPLHDDIMSKIAEHI